MSRTFVAPEAYVNSKAQVVPWSGPPAMETGAPCPAICMQADSLFVAYVCRNPLFPGWGSGDIEHPGFAIYCAVLQFEGVVSHYLGPPNDEALHLHPLHARGLKCYAFHEVSQSPAAPHGARHWIVTFHDETLEVIASSARVVRQRVDGEDTGHAAAVCAKQGVA